MSENAYLTDLEEGKTVTINCTIPSSSKEVEFKATIAQKSVGCVLLEIDEMKDKKLTFQGVNVRIIVEEDDAVFQYDACNVVYYKGLYAAQCKRPRRKINRRKNFRVGVSIVGTMLRGSDPPMNVYVRDVSASGFSITTDKELRIGEEITVRYNDLGLQLTLPGRIVRIADIENDARKIYGLTLVRESSAIENYVQQKQREVIRKRNR